MNNYFFVLAVSLFLTACSSNPKPSADGGKGVLSPGIGTSSVSETSSANNKENSGCELSSDGKGMLSDGVGTGKPNSPPCVQRKQKPGSQVQASLHHNPAIIHHHKPAILPLLTYWVERLSQKTSLRVNPSTVFHSGDVIRLHVNSRRSGYLYVVNEGSSGHRSIIYPSTSSASEFVESNRDYVIPARGHIRFDSQSGQETVWLFLSQRPLPLNANQNIDAFKDNALQKTNYSSCGSKDLVVESPESMQSNCGADAKDIFIEDDPLAQENTTTVGLPSELIDQGKVLAIKMSLHHE